MLHVGEVRHQLVGLGELHDGGLVVLGEKGLDAGRPDRSELAVAGLRDRGALQELADVPRGDQEIESLRERARRRERHELHHADDRRFVGDRRAAAVAVRGRSVRLDEVLIDDVDLESGHRAVGGGGLEGHALVQELVGEHDPRKSQDVHRVADLHLARGEADRRIDAVLHPEEREVTSGIGRRLAGAVDRRRRTEFLNLGLQLDAVRQHHRDLRLRFERGAGEGPRGGQAEPFLDLRLHAVHEPTRLELWLDARLIDRFLLQLV